MRKFIVKIILFTIIIIAIAICLECYIRTIPNTYSYKHKWIKQHKDSIECLITGSSHAQNGINPDCLSLKAFNIGMSSQNLTYDKALLDNYVPMCSNLKSVILTISYPTFWSKELEETKYWYYCTWYKLYMEIQIHPEWWSRYSFELAKPNFVREKIMSYWKHAPLNYYPNGQGTTKVLNQPTPWYQWESAVNSHTNRKDWSMVDYRKSQLEDIIKLCRQHCVKVVLVTTPTWHTYYDRLYDKQLSKMYEIIREIVAKYPDEVVYFDFLKDARFKEDDFFDCHHLSDKGAKVFSTILNDSIHTKLNFYKNYR